jgi:hypothetical protein
MKFAGNAIPHRGTTEEDWRSAQIEIEREEAFASRPPEHHKGRTRWKD